MMHSAQWQLRRWKVSILSVWGSSVEQMASMEDKGTQQKFFFMWKITKPLSVNVSDISE